MSQEKTLEQRMDRYLKAKAFVDTFSADDNRMEAKLARWKLQKEKEKVMQ